LGHSSKKIAIIDCDKHFKGALYKVLLKHNKCFGREEAEEMSQRMRGPLSIDKQNAH
jgi:hypothetical protein